jgi:hypothetical protein
MSETTKRVDKLIPMLEASDDALPQLPLEAAGYSVRPAILDEKNTSPVFASTDGFLILDEKADSLLILNAIPFAPLTPSTALAFAVKTMVASGRMDGLTRGLIFRAKFDANHEPIEVLEAYAFTREPGQNLKDPGSFALFQKQLAILG